MTYPLLLVYSEDKSIWENKIVGGGSPGQHLTRVACDDKNSSVFCVATGWGTYETNWRPVIAASQDGGMTWKMQEVDNYTNNTNLTDVYCKNGTCMAIGVITTLNQPDRPLIIASSDEGQTWQVKYEQTSPGRLRSIGCTEDTNKTVCAAVGHIPTKSRDALPLLLISTDRAETWGSKTIEGLPEGSHLESVSCIGTGDRARCVAVGYGAYYTHLTPVIVVSNDSGMSWQKKSIQGMPETGSFSKVHCSGEGDTATCVAGGGEGLFSSNPPLLAVSKDGGETWTTVSIVTRPSKGHFWSVHCNKSTCIAAGTRLESVDWKDDKPFVVVSHDGGKHWYITSTGLPDRGSFESVKCSETDDFIRCIAAGNAIKFNWFPILSMSTDAGNTWNTQDGSNLWDYVAGIDFIF